MTPGARLAAAIEVLADINARHRPAALRTSSLGILDVGAVLRRLDWLLLRGLEAVHQEIGRGTESDHKLLLADVVFLDS